jgi:hypothetical protein
MKVERVMWVVKTGEGKYVGENFNDSDFENAAVFKVKESANHYCLKGTDPIKVRVTIEEL